MKNLLFTFVILVGLLGHTLAQVCTSAIGISNVLYVSPTGSSPTFAPTAPGSLSAAIAAINGNTDPRRVIWLLRGPYTLTSISFTTGPVILDGGYDLVNGNWMKTTAQQSTINLTPGAIVQSGSNHHIGVSLINSPNSQFFDVRISLPITLTTSANYGHSVYGIYLQNSANFFMSRSSISTPAASNGAAGTAGARGANGANGGGAGCGGSVCAVGGTGGAGGAGAGTTFTPNGACNTAGGGASGACPGLGGCSGGSGGNGGSGTSPSGAGGTGGGGTPGGASFGVVGGTGRVGNAGASGAVGSPGATPAQAPLSNGAYNIYFYPSASNVGVVGGRGTGGRGGGGGGGGPAYQACGFLCWSYSYYNGGAAGGGGGGGEAGYGGNGGFPGGGNFGVYAYASAVNANSFVNCVFSIGVGGSGGAGGAGGAGGSGGSGSGGCANGYNVGGTGGNGGSGGVGGNGQQGAPGPSSQVTSVSSPGFFSNFAPGTASINTPTVSVLAGHTRCTYSEVQFQQSGAQTWNFGTNFAWVPLNPATSVATAQPTGNDVLIYYTTVGNQDVTIGGVTLSRFINIAYDRGADQIVNSQGATTSSLCLSDTVGGTNYFLYLNKTIGGAPTIADTYVWAIRNPITQTTATRTTTNNQLVLVSGTDFSTTASGTYVISVRAQSSCCGFYARVYHNFNVLRTSDVSFTLVNGEAGISGRYCPTFQKFNMFPAPQTGISFTITPNVPTAITQDIDNLGITNYNFWPSRLTPNVLYTINMTATLGGTCGSIVVSKTAQVYSVVAPTFSGLNTSYCVNSPNSTITLSQTGGILQGQGVILRQNGNTVPPGTVLAGTVRATFDPATAGVGNWTLQYDYTNVTTQCPSTTFFNVIVYTTANVFTTGMLNNTEYCLNDPPFPLVGSRSNGVFSPNPGLVRGNNFNNTFSPLLAGVGTGNVTFRVNDGGNACAVLTETKFYTIKPLPVVYNLTGPSFGICLNSNVTLVGSPAGGVYSGPGVTGNQFFTGYAGAGVTTLYYTTSDNVTGCTNTVTANLTVLPLLNADFTGLPSFICALSTPPLTLTAVYPETNVTTFSGNFIGEGSSVQTLATSPVSAELDWSSLEAGTKTVTFSVTNSNGCVTLVRKNYALFSGVTVGLLPPVNVSAAEFFVAVNQTNFIDYWVCPNDAPIEVSYFPQFGGRFYLIFGNDSAVFQKGNKVYFDPSQTVQGYQVLAYNFDAVNPDPACNYSDTKSIIVKKLDSLSLAFGGAADETNVNGTFCQNQKPIKLVGFPEGGIFNGSGVVGDMFYPSNVDVGTYNITYVRTGSAGTDAAGCTSTLVYQIEVVLTFDCNRYEVKEAPKKVNLTWLWAVIGVLGFLVLTCAILVAVIAIRKRKLTNDALMKEIELRKFDESFVDDIMANSTQYQKIPGIKLSSTKLASVLGGDEGTNWEIRLEELDIVREIGRGAYGIVYLARWRQEQVAMKKIIGDGSGNVNDDVIETFTAEIKLMKNLRPHPHVITMLGVVSDPLCIITKFYENGSLSELLYSDRKISMAVNITIMRGIASGMLHLHKENIIHRDLAARNVLLDKDFEPIISDFGLSRVVVGGGTGGNKTAMTRSDVGPIKWMPPESLVNKTYSIKSDVWAFGVTCWEILSRTEPFPDLEPLEVAFKVVQEGLRLTLPSNTPGEISEIIISCWNYNKEDRPDFSQLYAQLSTL